MVIGQWSEVTLLDQSSTSTLHDCLIHCSTMGNLINRKSSIHKL